MLMNKGIFVGGLSIVVCTGALAADTRVLPGAEEQQLPRAMHAPMRERPVVRVGQRPGENFDIVGADNRALQAAVDYVAGLGGGTVVIGGGDYLMRDSVHLRSFVTVRGIKGKTVLRKAAASSSLLTLDGDYGEEQITVADATGFHVGDGVTISDPNSGGFHTTVARITGRNGSTFSIDRPLNADYRVRDKAVAATTYAVVSGYHLEEARVEDLVVEGNKAQNPHLNGCRGAGIFLYRAFGTVIQGCTVRNFNGDGISFQQSNDVQVLASVSEGNASLGIHPGSGSQRPLVRASVARGNGEDGLFLCWRVRHGLFEKNVLEDNGRYGISIGHKDTDNLLRDNEVRLNHQDGVFFRNESLGMAGHRNRLENNLIENNGVKGGASGIRIQGETTGLVFRNNTIRDTRPTPAQKQLVGIRIEEDAGDIVLQNNVIAGRTLIEDRRKKK